MYYYVEHTDTINISDEWIGTCIAISAQAVNTPEVAEYDTTLLLFVSRPFTANSQYSLSNLLVGVDESLIIIGILFDDELVEIDLLCMGRGVPDEATGGAYEYMYIASVTSTCKIDHT